MADLTPDLDAIRAHIEPFRGCPDCDVRGLLAEIDRLTASLQRRDDLCAQAVRAGEARVAELERRLARAMGAIANYDVAFSGLGGTSDQMDDAEADGKALLAAYAKDRPAGVVP